MKYCDLHCDALTKEGGRTVTKENLRQGDCLLQCFAAFVACRENRFARAIELCDAFGALCEEEGYHPVLRAEELREDQINALFTVEEGGAIEGDLEKLETLFRRGMRMMSLTWNYPNELGFPNFPDYEGLCAGRVPFSKREARGLTKLGFAAVERMLSLGVIVDVSHASDGCFFDVVSICKRRGVPFVASHSGANAVLDCARNLTDEQIRLLADCGGVVGLDFCADFLSPDLSEEGQREAILAHARAIVNAGGEDALAFGSDFDGIPVNQFMKSPASMPNLLELLEREFGCTVAEKIARKNFLRVFKEGCK